MLTINLEKELVRQNKKLITSRELLVVNEYEKQETLVNNDALERLGLNNNLKKGEAIKSKISSLKEQTSKFNQERVFHISQIESLCMKYYLRFLPIEHYNGTVDDLLPQRISQFEVATGERCYKGNMRIVAPQESFKLLEKPVDPLMFFAINDEYFYLIHKWGNDLSILRRIKGFLSDGVCAAIIILLVVGIGQFIFWKHLTADDTMLNVLLCIMITLMSFLLAAFIAWGLENCGIGQENEWNSPIK